VRVAINARAAVRSEIGGVERLAREMARRLPRIRPGRYRVISPPPPFAHKLGHLWEQAALPLRSARCPLIYSPANLAPVISSRNVVVIHDAASLRHPEAYSRAYAVYHRAVLSALVRRARLLITVSSFSRGELVEVLGADPARIKVVPEGVDEHFADRVDPSALRDHGLETPYVLVVGTASARKNIGVLERAARALRERGIEIVMAGSDRSYLPPVSIPIRRLGYVADEHLPALYGGASALAMPSIYEGFGLPCLEAMACGTPVVAAASGALPETVADAGLLVASHDAPGFSEALLAVVLEDEVRRPLIEKGRARAAELTWDRTASLTDAAIGEALARA
jgi:glycosyltransferase involved in cell wall biosynthesis